MLYKFLFAAALLFSIVCNSPVANAQTVTFSTNVGDIVVELFPDDAPVGVANFLGYVNRGDYDGTVLHRSVPNFVVQGGGFFADTSAVPTQPPITNEFGRSNLRGTMAYARLGGDPDSATSQFFFNVVDNTFLDDVDDDGFTVFGEVVCGMEIVDAINGLPMVNAAGIFPAFMNIPALNTTAPQTLAEVEFVVVNSVAVSEPILLGDVDTNGVVDFNDIPMFVVVLLGNVFQCEADCDESGMVDFNAVSYTHLTLPTKA